MGDLSKLTRSDELRKAAGASSKRWLDDSRWKPVTIEEYVKFLDKIQSLKKELNAPDLPHPKMKGDRFSI